MNLQIQILSICVECLLLLKVTEIWIHLLAVLVTPSRQSPEVMAEEWPVSRILKHFRMEYVFRWPLLVIGLSMLLSVCDQHPAIYVVGIVLLVAAIFGELLQALFTRMTFGYKDGLFRGQSVRIRPLRGRKGFNPIYAMRDFIIFGSTLVFTSMVGWAGCYMALQHMWQVMSKPGLCFNSFFETAFDAFYFSVVTFATIGYGDNFPKTLPAKVLVVGEIMTSMASLGLLALAFSMTAQPNDGNDEKI